MGKTAYKFSHRSIDGKRYYWYSPSFVYGYVEMVSCSVELFWAGGDFLKRGDDND